MRINSIHFSCCIDEKLELRANHYEVETKRAMHSRIPRSCSDSSKFGKVKIAYFADLKDFDLVITDTGLTILSRYDKGLGLKLFWYKFIVIYSKYYRITYEFQNKVLLVKSCLLFHNKLIDTFKIYLILRFDSFYHHLCLVFV